MNNSEKLVELIEIISRTAGACAKCFNKDGSVSDYNIVSICTNKKDCDAGESLNSQCYGDCIGVYGEICLSVYPLEDDAKIVVTDEYIEVTGSVSGKWRFYPDGDNKSVFTALINAGARVQ